MKVFWLNTGKTKAPKHKSLLEPPGEECGCTLKKIRTLLAFWGIFPWLFLWNLGWHIPACFGLTNIRFVLGRQLTDAKFRVALTFPHLMLFASWMVNLGTRHAMISGSLLSLAILITQVNQIFRLWLGTSPAHSLFFCIIRTYSVILVHSKFVQVVSS